MKCNNKLIEEMRTTKIELGCPSRSNRRTKEQSREINFPKNCPRKVEEEEMHIFIRKAKQLLLKKTGSMAF